MSIEELLCPSLKVRLCVLRLRLMAPFSVQARLALVLHNNAIGAWKASNRYADGYVGFSCIALTKDMGIDDGGLFFPLAVSSAMYGGFVLVVSKGETPWWWNYNPCGERAWEASIERRRMLERFSQYMAAEFYSACSRYL